MYLLKLNANYVITDPKGFTFHYVSIKTVSGVFFEPFASIFTFHYVSIKTVMVRYENADGSFTLHSTMYLLKHKCSLSTI